MSEKKYYWNIFKKYHYLGHNHNYVARVFIGFIENNPVAFCSVLPFPHPIVKNTKRTHRLVVLPDYQGVGIGGKLHDTIANYFYNISYDYIITTSSPQLIKSLKLSKNWLTTRIGRVAGQNKGLSNKTNSSRNRITCAFKYRL